MLIAIVDTGCWNFNESTLKKKFIDHLNDFYGTLLVSIFLEIELDTCATYYCCSNLFNGKPIKSAYIAYRLYIISTDADDCLLTHLFYSSRLLNVS